MPQPVPELQEILALEAKIYVDKHDVRPGSSANFYNTGLSYTAAKLEAELSAGVLYIKR